MRAAEKELQFHGLRRPGVYRFETFQRFIECDDILVVFYGQFYGVERDLLKAAAASACVSRAGMLIVDSSLRRDGDSAQVELILDVQLGHPRAETQPGLVGQCGRAKRVSFALVTHARGG
jgi:hypothetical protein